MFHISSKVPFVMKENNNYVNKIKHVLDAFIAWRKPSWKFF